MGNNNAGCLSFFFPFLKMFVKKDGEKEILPYAKRDDFLSEAEASFYKVLRQAINEEIMICPKVGLKDIFFVKSRDRSVFMMYNNKIDRKHVDFLLCNSKTLKPVCGIELDDSSHQKESRKIRDSFVNELFEVSKLPLVRFENKKSYSLIEIREKIDSILNIKEKEFDEKVLHNAGEKSVPICPKCGINMVKRTVSKGVNKGKEFYGCSNFPKCREIKEIEVESESL